MRLAHDGVSLALEQKVAGCSRVGGAALDFFFVKKMQTKKSNEKGSLVDCYTTRSTSVQNGVVVAVQTPVFRSGNWHHEVKK